ncbi:clptm1 domain containing protein [Grosmannia clavigera kw1407]|uniref:Clptm1 domain containing protein n=1 Tax=Grosmannia clavigera (strain kw1407 / UAMH 11150) TaxID=655863 RepID=F0XD08_GROCL|nr:clptm1 domain containing protein [Grosmannia clavigera kw1407]EFX04387.1 clptm1 domain containing protein [Grosmannia clavigera kw1407]
MPQDNAPAGNARGEQGSSMTTRIIQMVAMYVGMQFVMKQFMPTAQSSVQTTDASGKTVQVPAGTTVIPPYQLRPASLDEGAVYNADPQRVAPIWPDDSKLDIIITVSHTPQIKPLGGRDADPVVLSETGFGLGNFSDKRAIDTVIDVPPQVQNNGTLWGHFLIGLQGSVLDPYNAAFDPGAAFYFSFPLTQYIARKKQVKVRNLLAGPDTADAEKELENEPETPSGPIIGSYYHANTSLSFIPNGGVMQYQQLPPVVQQFVHLELTGQRDGSGQNTWYYPVLFVNTFWQLKSQMTVLNETVKTLPLHLDLGNLADWKFKLMSSIEASSRETARQSAFGNPAPGGGDGSEIDMIKEILLDTNPILLCVTVVVSIVHTLLEMLAFGSDIAHYRKKKDNVGISVRSILANVFMQTVIFLYLVDNSQNTSWVILGSQGVGILIELWKVTTVVDVRLRDAPAGSLIPWRLAFEDKHKLSETEEKTKEYDEIAFKYMYVAAVPLLVAYAIYSLVYDSHKSWYSYVIATLVGSVYAYGFLMMVPSLYINYRLKSVAHMPGKAMMYKFVNTFIDDLFAFTIKMPFLHRLATFRDDIIFFVYIYQRWAYRTDYTRVNEFGQGGDDDETDEPTVKVVEGVKGNGVEEKGEDVADVKDKAKKAATGKASGSDAKAGGAKKRKQ